MTDNHVHIGQFYENYYEPLEILRIFFDAGIEGALFSSTTSGKEDVRYSEVEKEIASAFAGLGELAEKARALCWYIPDYAKQGVTVKAALESLPYSGIKIHPRANVWDLSDTNTVEIANAVFDYADCHEQPVLIHTGYDDIDRADKFERFFAEYPRAKITLAHCRPLDTTIEMLRRYKNVFCDTAFVPSSDIQSIAAAGFSARILTGSDFPITHYFRTKHPREGEIAPLTLPEQYEEDMRNMKASR